MKEPSPSVQLLHPNSVGYPLVPEGMGLPLKGRSGSSGRAVQSVHHGVRPQDHYPALRSRSSITRRRPRSRTRHPPLPRANASAEDAQALQSQIGRT